MSIFAHKKGFSILLAIDQAYSEFLMAQAQYHKHRV